MNNDNLYDILGVNKDASKAEIKSAYRQKAQETHPDKAKGSSEEFCKVAEAYHILSNDRLKLIYDKTGSCETTKEDKVKAAIAQCTETLNQVIIELGVEVLYHNIFDIALDTFTKRRQNIYHTLKTLKEAKGIINKLNKAVSRKQKGEKFPDVFTSIIQKHLQDIEYDIIQNKEQLEILAISRDIILTYQMNIERASYQSLGNFLSETYFKR